MIEPNGLRILTGETEVDGKPRPNGKISSTLLELLSLTTVGDLVGMT